MPQYVGVPRAAVLAEIYIPVPAVGRDRPKHRKQPLFGLLSLERFGFALHIPSAYPYGHRGAAAEILRTPEADRSLSNGAAGNRPRAFLGETVSARRSLPLYGAPYRSRLYGRRLAPIEDRIECVPQVVGLYSRRIVEVVVHRAVVA